MQKRVLVISYVALMSTTPNGRTMLSLLEGVEAQNISLFCCSGTPDCGSCRAAYKVTNKNALASILFPKKSGAPIDMSSISPNIDPFSDARKGKKKAWKYFVKEFVWKFGRWKKRALQWIKEQQVDYIVYMYGDTPSLQHFATYVSKKLNLPLLTYSCEDYCFKEYNYIDFKNNSIFFRLYHRASVKATKRLFAQSHGLIANSDMLGRLYQKKYNISNLETIMMASGMDFIENSAVREIDDTQIVYAGAIGQYRADALVDIANALGGINPKLSLTVYGRVSDEQILQKFTECNHLDFRGFVSYAEVLKTMYRSSLLIEAINLTEYVEKDKKFGFSTKYADCFACGTPLLVYAPETIVETEFAKEHDCAFVVTKKEDLSNTLRAALFNSAERKKCVENAQAVTQEFFNKENNIFKYNRAVSKLFASEEET